MVLRVNREQLAAMLAKTGSHEVSPEPGEAAAAPTRRRWWPLALAFIFGFGVGSGGAPPVDPLVIEVERVVTVPGPVQIVEVPVPIASLEDQPQASRPEATQTAPDSVGEALNIVPDDETLPDSAASTDDPGAFDDFDGLIAAAPDCWEDEVIVLVIEDAYGDLAENNTVGCVPADNLPVDGNRP